MPSEFPLQFRYRPLLTQGMMCVGKTNGGILILIDESMSREQTAITLWHELIHVLDAAVGRANDEERVEKLAAEWAVKCPEIVDLCRCPAP